MTRARIQPSLNIDQANKFAAIALAGISREYPNAPGIVLSGPADMQPPHVIHPAFFGCFDWHSSVHGHWMLVRLLRLFPDMTQAKTIRSTLTGNLSAANLQAEADYFTDPNHRSFERTYGWAWLLKLAEELYTWDDDDATTWSNNLQPLVKVIVAGYLDYLPKQTYPIRIGTHSNTAFGLAFALDYSRTTKNQELECLLMQRSRDYFLRDANAPAAWEPGGNDFFSPSLLEADLLTRVLPPIEFTAWFHRFLPELPPSLLAPPTVSDRSDLQLVHLDGLSLSRAWCMKRIASTLPGSDSIREVLTASAERHTEEGLSHVASGHYGGEHWLASFAVYLLFG
jgi:hypothetical protein